MVNVQFFFYFKAIFSFERKKKLLIKYLKGLIIIT